jgi:hypothetical protein
VRRVDLTAEHQLFVKLGNQAVMRLDDRVRCFNSGRQQGGVCGVVHRVIGAAARSFGLPVPQERTRLIQSPFGFPQVTDDGGGNAGYNRNPSRLMLSIGAGLLKRSGCFNSSYQSGRA